MKYVVYLNGKNYEVDVEETQAVITSVTEAAPVANPTDAAPAPAHAAPVAAAPAPAATKAAPAAAGGKPVKAPMPGTINAINVSAGQAVKKGDVLVILEAMKMENEIMADADGTVAAVNVTKGQAVNTGDVLLSLN